MKGTTEHFTWSKKKGDTLPNFLIVGAAKSGTTSLYHYLKQHPEIFMSPVKEPNFLSFQFEEFPYHGVDDYKWDARRVKTYQDYCRLFSASRGKKAIGEASVSNLVFSDKVIPFIKELLGDPKIIIMLRNPVERAFSAYLYSVRDNREDLTFEQSLRKEEERKKAHWSPFWFHKEGGFYYERVKAYQENFSKVGVYLYDDLKNDPAGLLKDIYDFLEVDSSFIPHIKTRHNVSGVPRSRMFNNLLIESNPLRKILRPTVSFFLGQERYIRLREAIRAKNLRRPRIKEETVAYLKELYREDVLKLQALLGRDLSHWIR